MKRFSRVSLVVLGTLAVLLLILNYGMGTVVKTAVERGGPVLLGVPVTIEKTHFRLLQGIVHLNGFALGNPEGFKTRHAISVNEVAVEFDPKSLFSDTIVIQRIYVKSPEIVYELGLGKSNIGRILERLEGSEESGKPADKPKPAEDKSGKNVIIEDFLIEGARVRLSATLAMGAAAPIPLPPIHLKDIGKEEGRKGASAAEVVRKVFGAIGHAVTGAVTGTVGLIGDGAKAVGQGAGKAVEGVKNLFGFDGPAAATNAPAEPPVQKEAP
jgi:uncharacterized protein involved in outer membrane biogenesis